MSRERDDTFDDDEIAKKLKREYSSSSIYIDAVSAAGNNSVNVTNMGRRQYHHHMNMNMNMMLASNTSPAGGGSLNTITPCAACKLLRRRCAQECPFSPYFSPHEPHKFASVHKVFGASNVSKLLMDVPESQRADAANSLVYEANVRLRDPVYGCMGAISALQQQVQSLQAQLSVVRAEILRYNKYYTSTTTTVAAAANRPIITNNNILEISSNSSHPHLSTNAHLLPVGVGVAVTTVVANDVPTQSPPPPTPPPTTSSSSNSMYTTPTTSTATNYSTISNDNVSYFG